jgi:hypothetical protein
MAPGFLSELRHERIEVHIKREYTLYNIQLLWAERPNTTRVYYSEDADVMSTLQRAYCGLAPGAVRHPYICRS